jgi:outer membrane lipoprotein-sorting protein
MKCLSQGQLAQLVLGRAHDTELAAHLEKCDQCRADLEVMQVLRHELVEAHASLDKGHEAARQRLLAALPRASVRSKRARISAPAMNWIGGLTMRQRIALGGVSAAVVVGLLLFWAAIGTKPVSAMEKMAEHIRSAKSFKATFTCVENSQAPEPGKPPRTAKMVGTIYWLAPGTSRGTFEGQTLNASGAPTEMYTTMTNVSLPDKTTMHIEVDHRVKTFCKGYTADKGDVGLEMIAKLGEFSGQPDRDLGTKEIDGKESRGFEITVRKLFGDSRRSVGPAETVAVWIDPNSSLPVLVHIKWKDNCSEKNVRLENLQWNIGLDPSLFDVTPPKGYTDVTPSSAVPPSSHAMKTRAQ